MRGDIPSGFSPLPPLRFVRYILITTRLQPFILSSTRAELRLPMPGALSGSSFPILLKNVFVCMKIRLYPSELTVHYQKRCSVREPATRRLCYGCGDAAIINTLRLYLLVSSLVALLIFSLPSRQSQHPKELRFLSRPSRRQQVIRAGLPIAAANV